MRSTAVMRLTAVLAAGTLALSACSGDDDSDGGGGSVDLTMWAWAPGTQLAVDLWNEQNPDIQVTLNEQEAGEGFITKVLTAIRAGDGAPDILQAEYQMIPTLVSGSALTDIADLVDGDVAGQFPDGMWSSVTLGSDAVYAIPQDSGPMMFYYRADIFDDLNLEVPTTWEEYAQVARDLRAADDSKYLGTFSSDDPGQFAGLSQQAGGSWWGIDGEAWSVNIDDEPTRRVAEFWGGLVEEGVIDNKPMYTPEWNAGLNDGTQVGWVGSVWSPGVLSSNAADTEGLWEMAPLPQWDAATPATGNWGGSSIGVGAQTDHVEEATEFVTWLNTSQEAMELLVTEGNIYPANLTHQESLLSEPPAFFPEQTDFYELAGEIAQTTNPFTYGPNVNVAYSAYTDEFTGATDARTTRAFLDAVAAMQQTTYDDLVDAGFNVTG